MNVVFVLMMESKSKGCQFFYPKYEKYIIGVYTPRFYSSLVKRSAANKNEYKVVGNCAIVV